MRPSSRGQPSSRYGDSRPSRPARPRLNRETVDHAWENGAPRDHADYHPRKPNARPYSQQRPYNRDGNAPSPNNRRPYSQGNGNTRYGNQGRGDARPSTRPYGDRRNRSFNDSERPYGSRNERPGGYAGGEQRPYRRYENRQPGARYDDNRDYNQRSPRRYGDDRASDRRPPRRDYDDRPPYQRSPRRYDDDRASDRRPPRRDYDNRGPRNEYRQPAARQERDDSDFQVAPSEDTDEDGLAEGERFQGDYERFNEAGAPSPAKRPGSPQRKLHTTWSKQPKDKAGRDEHKPRAKAEAKPTHKKVKRAAKEKPAPATRPWQKGYKWPTP